MKKYSIILTLAIVTFFMGCSDSLDRFPVDQLVEQTAYNTVNDLQFGLNGVIGNFDYDYIISFNSIFTDNCRLGVDNGGQDIGYGQQILNANYGNLTGAGGIPWNNRYSGINDMNRLIVAAGTISPGASDREKYNNILAQTYAFRAMAHYDLLLYYAFDITDGAALGVPYVDYVSAEATPGRNTVGEVLTGIQNDLDTALSLYPSGTNDINFTTPDFVTFLRARIALETGDNQAAIGFCSSLIGDYPLADISQYFAMFNEDADKTEVVFNRRNVQGADSGINFLWNFSGQGPKWEISNELFALYEADDIRRTVVLDPVSDVDADLLIVGKYPINGDANAINDFKAMRISELYLIRAEAYAKTGQFGLASEDVLSVQTARHINAPADVEYTALGEAIDGIIAERRLELAFEGHRYNDIKRVRDITGEGIERVEANGDCGGSTPCSLPASDNRFILPIPQIELNANAVISGQQAPGY